MSGSGKFIFTAIAGAVVALASSSPPVVSQVALVGGGDGPASHASVALWSDLAGLSGRGAIRSVHVREADRAGHAVFVRTAALPAWAAAGDITGLCITDASGTGKWVHRWRGPVDFGRLGTQQDGNPADERAAFAALIAAGFDHVHVPEGSFDGYLNLQVSSPLRITGAGPDETVFVGDGIGGHAAFLVDASLQLENLKFVDQPRLAWANVGQQQGLGTVRIELSDVVFEVGDSIPAANNAAIQTGGSEPLPGTAFHLEMSDCRFRVGPEMEHVSARSGLTGFVERCSFAGGRRGLSSIPSSDSGHFPGATANEFSPDFRVADCVFDDFTYTGGADSYHLQVAGRRWVISGCTFGSLGAGASQAGHIYSNLEDSQIIGCSFEGGGFNQLFFKGSERLNPSMTVANGNGWGNTVLGCTFDGAGSVLQQGQIYMNVREQRFIGCTFRDYQTYAIVANQQGTNSDNLLIQGCEFSTSQSPSAIRLINGGRNIRILDCTFAGITGTTNARLGVIVTDPFPAQTTYLFEDVRVEGCSFLDNAAAAVIFYRGNVAYTVRRFRFVGNTVSGATARGFVAAGGPTIEDMILEDNTIDVLDRSWVMPAGCVRRSVDNLWTQTGGTALPTAEALGVTRGTVVGSEQLMAGQILGVSADARVLLVAGANSPVSIGIANGSFDAHEIVLVGSSDTNAVTVSDGVTVSVAGASRTLGEGDTLRLMWVASLGVSGQWCEVGFSDN